eukprot:3650851-Pyramimonas_sp.AAC.1
MQDGVTKLISDRDPVTSGGDDGDDVDLDARILEVTRDRLGKRFKDFKVAVDLTSETEWDSWPLTGPRTTK